MPQKWTQDLKQLLQQHEQKAPFSEEETQEMLINLGKLMGLEFDAETPKQIHYQSGGHPFVSRQIARFLTGKIKDNKNTQNGNLTIKWVMVERYLERPRKTFK